MSKTPAARQELFARFVAHEHAYGVETFIKGGCNFIKLSCECGLLFQFLVDAEAYWREQIAKEIEARKQSLVSRGQTFFESHGVDSLVATSKIDALETAAAIARGAK